MADELKEKIIIQTIRNYINKDFTDDEIKEKYCTAIEYMTDKFVEIFEDNNNINISSKSDGTQSISYSNSSTDIIGSNLVLKSLIGPRYIRMW